MKLNRFAALAALLLALPAWGAQKTPAQLSTQAQSSFADNVRGAITPKVLRDNVQDIVDSFAPLSSLVVACPTNQWVSSIGAGGVTACAQIGFSNLSGAISPTQIPYPSLSSIGGVVAINAVSQQFITSINTSGVPILAQPAFTDLSGVIAAAQLIAPGASTFGAVKSSAAPSNQFATGINTSGVVTYAQPAFSNLSGTIAAAQLVAPAGGPALGAVKSSTAGANQFATGIDTTGAVTYARPDASNVTFLQSGTGAVSRDLLAKEKEIVSVTDFGALCNSNGTHGNGNDDTSAIQAAINYAGPLGAEVVFPRGVCRTTATLNASTTNNVYRLKGAGYASQIFNDSTSPTATITANASSYSGGSCPISIMPCVSVEGLTFLPPNATGAGNSVLAGTANQHIRFVGNNVKGYRVGVILATSYGPEIIGNTFSNVLSNAIYLAADSTGNHAYIANNRLFANGLTTNDAAIFVGGTVSAINVISNDLESNYIGVLFGAVTGLTFTGNFIELSTSANLYFTTTATGVTLTGNTFNSAVATTLDISKSLIAANFGASWTVTWSAGSTGNLFYSNPAGWATPPSSVAIDAVGAISAPSATLSGAVSAASASLSGALSAASASVSGNVTALHQLSSVSVPTPSACGTSPAVDAGSSNNGGKVTFGTGTTACTLTFASAYPTNAYCSITPMAQPGAVGSIPYVSAQSKTAFTISGGVASGSYLYNCAGN